MTDYYPDELEEDIARAVSAVHAERETRPGFRPTTSFLQRRLRWGYIRAVSRMDGILAALNKATEETK